MSAAIRIDAAITEALRDRPEAAALACVDVSSGFVLGISARDESSLEGASVAALAAPQLCAAPVGLSGGAANDPQAQPPPVMGDEAFVVAKGGVYAFSRVPRRPDLVVVGVGAAGASVALLVACVKALGGVLGEEA